MATTRSARRPFSATLLAFLTAFQAASALFGGGAMLLAPQGGAVLPIAMLDGSPFGSFLIPGLLLFGVLGVVPLVVTWGLTARPRRASPSALERRLGSRWPHLAAGGVGIALLVFLAVEAAMIGFHPLQAVYGAVGASIVAAALWPATRRWYRT